MEGPRTTLLLYQADQFVRLASYHSIEMAAVFDVVQQFVVIIEPPLLDLIKQIAELPLVTDDHPATAAGSYRHLVSHLLPNQRDQTSLFQSIADQRSQQFVRQRKIVHAEWVQITNDLAY